MLRKNFHDTLSNKGSSVPTKKTGHNLSQNGAFHYELLAILFIFILGIAYSYHVISKSLEFSPVKLFEKAFVESPESVKDLKGDSKAMVGFDSWIRFNCPAGTTLRDAREFKPYIAEVARRFFIEKYPDDKALEQPINHYEYLTRTTNSVGNIVNEGLLINKETHDYYYHTWGI